MLLSASQLLEKRKENFKSAQKLPLLLYLSDDYECNTDNNEKF